jgi:uncharacterized protein (DUF427 family)
MPRAIWNDVVIAESDAHEVVDGNVYFPAAALKREFFKESAHTSRCGWKGTASYYTLVVGGQENRDAAWYYPKAKDAARHIEGHVAFWRGVRVER